MHFKGCAEKNLQHSELYKLDSLQSLLAEKRSASFFEMCFGRLWWKPGIPCHNARYTSLSNRAALDEMPWHEIRMHHNAMCWICCLHCGLFVGLACFCGALHHFPSMHQLHNELNNVGLKGTDTWLHVETSATILSTTSPCAAIITTMTTLTATPISTNTTDNKTT